MIEHLRSMIREMERSRSDRAEAERKVTSPGRPASEWQRPPGPSESSASEPSPSWQETEDDGCLRKVTAGYREGCPADLRRVPEQCLRALQSVEPGLVGLEDWLYLDLETTGLTGAGTIAFLVGFGEWIGDTFQITQILLKDRSGEERLLGEVEAKLSDRPVLVTFNGKAFDWPILSGRFVLAGLIPPERPLMHLDLLSLVKSMGRRPEFGQSLRDAIKRFSGRARQGDIPGSLIPALYFVYEREGDLTLLEPVMLHNRLDVLDMACLVSALGRILTGHRDAGDPTALGGAGKLHYRKGNLDLARRCLEAALDASSAKAVEGMRVLGHILRRQGDWQAAEDVWERIAASGQKCEEDFLWLARCREHSRGPEEALEVVENAVAWCRLMGREVPESILARRRRLERILDRKRTS